MALGISRSEFSVRAVPAGPGATRLVVAGEVDLETAPALDQALRTELANGRAVRLDLSGAAFFDSAAVTVLVHASHEAKANAWDLTIAAALPPVVERVMKATETYETLPLVDERWASESFPK